MRKKAKAAFDPKKFLAKVGEGKTVSILPEGSNCFLPRRNCGRGLLHSARQGQAHRRFQARQGSGGCNRGTRSFFW